MYYILDYLWVDGYNNIRSKTRVVEIQQNNSIDICKTCSQTSLDPKHVESWSFDGSSTGQAEGKDSDVLLVPVATFPNPFYIKDSKLDISSNVSFLSYLVLCECYNKNMTPHITNTRYHCKKTYDNCLVKEPLFGIEQEYVLFKKMNNNSNDTTSNDTTSNDTTSNIINIGYKWLNSSNPGQGPQGLYYCGVGGNVAFGRNIVDKHLLYCLYAGIKICGTNAEVMASQWEFQVGPLNPLDISDQLIVARYILMRITEEYDCFISLHPKPLKNDWNGSGGHVNYSTNDTRNEINGLQNMYNMCEKLEKRHEEHMKVYGENNDERLTGTHETSSIHDFSWGISDRGKSIRIPLHVYNKGCGYLEDRRPAANLDPYLVTNIIMETTILYSE